MESAAIIGIDLAKSVFQLHGADVSGRPLFRKKLARDQLLVFLASQPPSTITMEACGSAHDWSREMSAIGHDIRLIPPIYVKPFVKRHKNGAADAEAISEAAVRPTMRFVPVKTAEQQSRAMVFKTRDLLVHQRNQIVNALRGHLMEYGITVPAGLTFVRQLEREIEDPDTTLPLLVVELARLHFDQLQNCNAKIATVERQMKEEAKRDPEAMRLLLSV